MSDESVCVLLQVDCFPEEPDERVGEESFSQLNIIFFEDQEQWAFSHRLVCWILRDAREEQDEHFRDVLIVKERF